VNQDIANSRRKAAGTGDSQCLRDFYLSSLSLAPNVLQLLKGGKLSTDVKSASDYSYSSSSYAIPYARTVGDAGCFIDPFFSSGVHLALTGGLSAAATICAAIRGDCTEEEAVKWHSSKVTEAYKRFLVVVLSAYRQMHRQDQHILSQMQEDNFDDAFNHLRPSK
jgi:flavin-dependent dehydrogenase